MKYLSFAAVAPLALLLGACSSVPPAYQDNGTRQGPCVEGGPDSVAQQFYDLRLQQPSQGIPDAQLLAKYRPYLSDRLYQALLEAKNDPHKASVLTGDIFSSERAGAASASVADASTIPGSDARNIPLRVALSQGSKTWQDEVQMERIGQCWTVNDVRYLGHTPHIAGGSLNQLLTK